MDNSVWFMVAIVVGALMWTAHKHTSEIGKVESEPIMVDVDEQEYRVKFTVKQRETGVVAYWIKGNNDILVASVDERTPTGWRHVGEHTSPFRHGTYGRYDEVVITNDRNTREHLAKRAVEAILAPPRW